MDYYPIYDDDNLIDIPTIYDDIWNRGGSTEVPISVGDGHIIYIGKDIHYAVANRPVQNSNEYVNVNLTPVYETSSNPGNGNYVVGESYEKSFTPSTYYPDNNFDLKTVISNGIGIDLGSQTKDVEFQSVSKSIDSSNNNGSQDDGNTSVDINANNPVENTQSINLLGIFGLLVGLLFTIILLV